MTAMRKQSGRNLQMVNLGDIAEEGGNLGVCDSWKTLFTPKKFNTPTSLILKFTSWYLSQKRKNGY
jgi:hypothetical protein